MSSSPIPPDFPDFPFFSILPDELKLKIWRFAVPSPGVHYFQLGMGKSGLENQVLNIEPVSLRDDQNDSSAWRDRRYIKKLCNPVANEALRHLQAGKELYRHIPTKKEKSPAGSIVAKVEGVSDIVCFRVPDIILDAEFFPFEMNRPLFSQLKRVAIEYKWTKARNTSYGTFNCFCDGALERTDKSLCHIAIADLLHYFADMHTFYFILRLHKIDIVVPPAERVPRSRKRKQQDGPKPTELKSDECIWETMKRFRAIAIQNDLEIFHDRYFTYYEVREADTENLAIHGETWKLVTDLEKEWRERAEWTKDKAQKRQYLSTKFKVIVAPHKREAYEVPRKRKKAEIEGVAGEIMHSS
ncbi:hypothetical protein F4779DRAFT_362822 [Xylariaceae sp. FL0662B]|nr:hypothetical protein F4779DRAFT_362822 [Xylariaceae sp. FL0662B]